MYPLQNIPYRPYRCTLYCKKNKRESSFNIMRRWMGVKITMQFSVKINMLENVIFDHVHFRLEFTANFENLEVAFAAVLRAFP